MEVTCTAKEEDLSEEEFRIRNARYNPYRDLIFDYFAKSKAPKTVEQYLGAFERAKKWAKGMKLSVLPMSVDDLLAYLVCVSENAESFAAVKMARYGIAYVHQMAGTRIRRKIRRWYSSRRRLKECGLIRPRRRNR